MMLKLVKVGAPAKGERICCPEDVHKMMRRLGEADREELHVIHLDARKIPIATELIARGTLNECAIHPREIFKAAIINNSASIILVHNHPSGDPEPSDEDIKITHRIQEVGQICGINLLDHVIIGHDCCQSIISRACPVSDYFREALKKKVEEIMSSDRTSS
jgi:DNA repair protein RadC